MTLRRRLLLVYLIVVLINVAALATALFELDRAHQIIRELQDWNHIVDQVESFRAAFDPTIGESPEQAEMFTSMAARLHLELGKAPSYLDVDRILGAVTEVKLQYSRWLESRPEDRLAVVGMVREPLDNLVNVVHGELGKLNARADAQALRMLILIMVVVCLVVLHVAVTGALLRRWLLAPMEQLNRQVAALARDEPPGEPLLTEPLEMANLAQALDQARRSLGALQKQLIESERLKTIGQFAAQLAHNLRNPLAAIRAAAQVAGRHDREDAYVGERMDEIVGSVDRLNRWIAGLMEVARREPTPTSAADVVPVLERVRESLTQELAAKDLSLTIEAPREGLVCPHHPETLEHALIAMVVNAIEASPVEGAIRVRAERIGSAGDRPPVCRISVVDQGTGLGAGPPDRIFEFSYSTKQRGVGLGLALARQTLQRQGGQAHALSNPEGGATVYLELPIGPGGVDSGAESAAGSTGPDRGAGRGS